MPLPTLLRRRPRALPGHAAALALTGSLATAFLVAPLSAQPATAPWPTAAIESNGGMVVSASALASQTGRDVLKAGGNAIDAAVATGFALAVTYPTAGNIGGGGFMVIRFPDGRSTAIDFREKAPARASATMFTDSSGAYSARTHHNSHVSVGVPGTVAGFAHAHGKYGKTPWKQLVQPAATMAGEGFEIPTGLAASLAGARNKLGAFPASVAAYYKNGTPFAAGERLVLGDLAKTLERVRDQGRDGFYRGTTAQLIAAEMARHGGLITEADLAAYEPAERTTVRGTYRGYEIISMPPPSSGGTAMIEMLNILEGYDLKSLGHNSPQYVHYLVESMRRAYRDRAQFMGDPDFITPPVSRLTSKEYAAEQRHTIDPAKASPSAPSDIAQRPESEQTTHYSVVDKDGLAVSVTYTLEVGYGLGAVVDGAGFLLNNEMGDFNGKPGLTDSTGLVGTTPNIAQPGKRPLSSMTPTIVAKDGKLVAIVGTVGGRTIINTVMEVVLNLIDFQMAPQDAVNALRFHHQWLPNTLSMESRGTTPALPQALEGMGHVVRLGGNQGAAHSIFVNTAGRRFGAADPRDRDAGARGH